jgi:aspartate aminotransferase
LTLAAPDGAFYIWPNITSYFGKSYKGKKITGSSDFSNALLEDQKVVLVPGAEFGLEGFVRISFALKDESMKEAAKRMRTFVESLS